jgi:Ser/Thr protein kinase RdoA (MazF antagonist)
VNVHGERAGGIVAWVEAQAAAMEDLGFPPTLVHGDFHPENVLRTDDGPVIIDWSDAAVAHPLVDMTTWSSWLSDDPERGERAWRRFFEAWADVCPIERVEARRAELAGVTAAYHVVSYAGIVRALEPLRRSDLGAGLRQYLEILERAVPP